MQSARFVAIYNSLVEAFVLFTMPGRSGLRFGGGALFKSERWGEVDFSNEEEAMGDRE